jgi:hypothetical protein
VWREQARKVERMRVVNADRMSVARAVSRPRDPIE